ncbi:YggU family protein [Candidatus Woesearchaeota archaeon]|nr:YggU family protein [Candidatus Woesearchaeota archaeon]
MINPADYIKDNSLRIIVKPGKKQNYVLGYDLEREAVIVEIKAPAQDNKANKEVIKYFYKLLKRHVKIKSGYTSHVKVLLIQ